MLFYLCVCASFFFCVILCVANELFRPWPAFIGCLSINSIQFISISVVVASINIDKRQNAVLQEKFDVKIHFEPVINFDIFDLITLESLMV